jgi:hypothetical protein
VPHAALKIVPGVDTNKTPALNEAAVSETNLIRFVPDRNGLGLPQKLGGWTQYFPNHLPSPPRALWAWEDTNARSWLAVGAEASLSVINAGNQIEITPETTQSDVAVDVSTTAGSALVTITDSGSNIDEYDTVFIKTQISVGGLVLFGLYPCQGLSANSYQIVARDLLGRETPASATVTNGGAVLEFDTTANSAFVTVTLDDHGLAVGSTFPVLVPTTVGGVTLSGNYVVKTVVSSTQFTIQAGNQASTTASAFVNGGLASLLYYNGVGPLPTGTGFGVLGYGIGGFGTGVPPVPGTGTPITTTDWTLDNWGETLIACPRGGPIFAWSPTVNDLVATILPFGPPVNAGAFVAMPQRQVIAWGSTFNGVQDPLLIRWSDVNDYDVWVGQITNQAGSFRIPKGSKIIQCIQGPQQGLVWTDVGVWAMQYAGPPFVYQFNELGVGCGLIGPKAAASINGIVYWMGPSQFFRLAGSGVEPVQCPIWDVIFQDIDFSNADRIRVAPNSRFGEISWFYPTHGSNGEPTKYVKYNIALNSWDFGELCRTAWINESVLGPPIGSCGLTRYIFQHETSTDANGNAMASSFQTGYFALTEGNDKMFVDQVWPDMKWGYYGGAQNATVKLTFFVTDYPGETPRTYGPFTLTQATDYVTPRFRGRLVAIKIESDDFGSWWRLGNMRYRYQPDGRV